MIRLSKRFMYILEYDKTLLYCLNSFAVLYYNVKLGITMDSNKDFVTINVSNIPEACFNKTLNILRTFGILNDNNCVASELATIKFKYFKSELPVECIDATEFIRYFSPKNLTSYDVYQNTIMRRCVEIITHFFPSSRVFTPKCSTPNCVLLYTYNCIVPEELLSSLIIKDDYKLHIESISYITQTVLDWYNLSV